MVQTIPADVVLLAELLAERRLQRSAMAIKILRGYYEPT